MRRKLLTSASSLISILARCVTTYVLLQYSAIGVARARLWLSLQWSVETIGVRSQKSGSFSWIMRRPCIAENV